MSPRAENKQVDRSRDNMISHSDACYKQSKAGKWERESLGMVLLRTIKKSGDKGEEKERGRKGSRQQMENPGARRSLFCQELQGGQSVNTR